MFDEFKAFAFKGNVVDLAVGVVIGTAFGGIVNSLVKNIIMPAVGAITSGEYGYADWKVTLNGSEIPIGLFLGDVVNFLIVALALFIFIKKFLGWVMSSRKQEVETPAAPVLTKDQELLVEIRDLLAHKN